MFRTAVSSMPVTLRRAGLVALACSTLLLSACGGGSRASQYHPDRIVSFGDENSAISSYSGNLKNAVGAATGSATLRGLTYTANSTVTSAALACADDASATYCTTSVDATGYTFGATSYVIPDANYPNTVIQLENSSSPAGLKRTTSTTYLCNVPTIWVQTVARAFGKGYHDACPIDAYGNAVSYAVAGATVSQVAAQVAAHRGELGKGVLVTMMAGQNDILEQYQQVKGGNNYSQADAEAALRVQAAALAAVVNDIMGTGAKVVLALTPDLGQSPLAIAAGDQVLLSALTKVFNDELYINRLGTASGRNLAGFNTVNLTSPTIRSSSYVYDRALCDPASLNLHTPDGQPVAASASNYDLERARFCNSNTYVSGGNVSTFIWADSVRFAPIGHSLIGATAAHRAADQF